MKRHGFLSGAYLEELVELAQLVRLGAQLVDLLHRVRNDGQLVGPHRLAVVQQRRQLRKPGACESLLPAMCDCLARVPDSRSNLQRAIVSNIRLTRMSQCVAAYCIAECRSSFTGVQTACSPIVEALPPCALPVRLAGVGHPALVPPAAAAAAPN